MRIIIEFTLEERSETMNFAISLLDNSVKAAKFACLMSDDISMRDDETSQQNGTPTPMKVKEFLANH